MMAMDWMTTTGHVTLLAVVVSGLRIRLWLERNGSPVPKLRFKFHFDSRKSSREE